MSWKIAGNNDLKQKGGHSQDKKDDYLVASSWRGNAVELIASRTFNFGGEN